MTISKKQMAEAVEAAYKRGYEEGHSTGRQYERQQLATQKLEAQVKLMNAAGQAMQVNASLLSGLGQVFDCGPR